MNTQFRTFLMACLFAVSGTSNAQVANGDFSSGPSSWVWRQAMLTGAILPSHCFSAMTEFQPSPSRETPWDAGSASSRVADLTGPRTASTGNWMTCRQIEQLVYIQPGMRLAFDAKLGDNLASSSSGEVNPVGLFVPILYPATGIESTHF